MASGGECKYSCKTASETLEWIHAIINFLKPYRFFLDAHVVNFFKERLWEAVDKEWMDCLRKEPVDDLLRIPSGAVQDHWPASLKEFVLTLRSLSLPREQADLQKAFPGLQVSLLNNVLAQGMNHKKKHEIEALSAVIGSIASRVGVDTIVDVGSGQGYLSQVLSFEYQLSVIAIDASSHHGRITDARAERIKKHYAAKLRKYQYGLENRGLITPKTVTCRVLSPDMLKALSNSLLQKDDQKPNNDGGNVNEKPLEGSAGNELTSSLHANGKPSLVLAGLHACGDLSVTMLRTFIECTDVRAVISIGCCYNLLSEGIIEADTQCGFPMSKGVKSAGLLLGKNARDLACQSAERWRGLGEAAGLHNFELHAFRAAFQMVLFQHYPEIIIKSPAIGRQGKALRRQHHRRILESSADIAESLSQKNCKKEASCSVDSCTESADTKGSTCNDAVSFHEESSHWSSRNCKANPIDRYSMFVKFCRSGLHRLGLHNSEDIEFSGLWKQVEPFSELIGPYWTLRAALGPVLETLLLLDRLLFLQESSNMVEAVMLPIFDAVLSPRNVALIAKKL
ncbi:S-adenosyl-L-methionine-dependent methyltransferase superfamily protein [Forsythia ovata]|uniref:S-adenosyl-L-methionine-dependent methyltransferase superfamily protein n=1 Tax=Forsythia ovata TaxID=205694 RepID=A0ABD1R618_9LAMI